MHILLVSQWFNPEPTLKGIGFARKLKDFGHTVEVLTGFPNYPGGKIYSGYRVKIFQREIWDGIPVNRVPLYPSHDGCAIKRLLNYSSFAVSASAFSSLVSKAPDVIYVYHPPATVGLTAVLLSKIHRAPILYDIQDLWPDTLSATGMINNGVAIGIVGLWCRWVYKHASKIVVLSPGFKNALVARGVKKKKIKVIYNWCEENYLGKNAQVDGLARQLKKSGRFNVVFAGTMGEAQALGAVLDAAALIEKIHPRIQFVFIGGGIAVDRLQQKVRKASIRNVRFLKRQPVSEIGKFLSVADVLLVHLKDNPLFEITIPSKIQAYMAVGKPILTAVKGDASELVKKAAAGMICKPENPADIARAVEKLYRLPPEKLREMGENGRRFYQRELSLDAGVKQFHCLFSALGSSQKQRYIP